MKKITLFLLGLLFILPNVAKADTGDVTSTTATGFTPTAGKVYRIFSYGQYNGSSSLTTVRKYLTITSGVVAYTETYDASNNDLLWTVTSDGTNFTFYNFNQGMYLKSNGSSSPTLSSTSENFTLTYVKQVASNSTTSSGYYILNSTPKGLELGTAQYNVFFKNGAADRYRFEWGFQEVDAPVTTLPTIAMSSGNSAQTVYQTQAIKTTVYKWGGTANSATLIWTGTASASTAPDGITVTSDGVSKTVTISGALNTLGSYGYSITSTDGPNTATALTGTLNTKTTSKYKMAYITTVTAGAPAALDLNFINGLSNSPGNDGLSKDFDLTYISSTETGVDYSIYDLIVESSIPGSDGAGLAELKTKALTKPLLNMKSFQLQSTRWNWCTPANTTTTTITVPDAKKTHPLFNGITFSGASSNEIILTTATTGNMAVNITAWAGTPSPSVPITLSTVKDATGLACYFEIPVGSTMNGMTSPTAAKQVYLGLSEAAWGALTADAVTLAVNAAKYVIVPAPKMALTSGSNSNSVNATHAMTTVVYTWSGTVTSTAFAWTGTADAATAPTGITVTTDTNAKTYTISGIPTIMGNYGYTVSATDGNTASSITGIFTVNDTNTSLFENSAKTVLYNENYNFNGTKLSKYARGFMIQKTIYNDGSSSYKKIYLPEYQK